MQCKCLSSFGFLVFIAQTDEVVTLHPKSVIRRCVCMAGGHKVISGQL